LEQTGAVGALTYPQFLHGFGALDIESLLRESCGVLRYFLAASAILAKHHEMLKINIVDVMQATNSHTLKPVGFLGDKD
jgi:hypothetical protein